MLGHRDMTMQDYADIFKRRVWLILACTVLILGISVGVSYMLPPQYMSQTLVLIEQQKVPENYVKPVVNEDLNARLASMREQILSRTRLEPIIERFNLYAGNKTTMDDRVDLTRKAIGINPIPQGPSSHGMPGFFITFKARDARTAQQVCGEITSLFVSANLSAREESAEGTTDFLKQQLADAKTNLDEQDAKLAAFEQKNLSRLPGQTIHFGDMNVAMGSANESTLQSLTARLDAKTQEIGRLQQGETLMEAMIAQPSDDPAHIDPATGASGDSLETQLKAALAQQKDLESLYTPDYPDVVANKRRIASLRTAIAQNAAAPAKSNSTSATADTPQLRHLKAQLHAQQDALAAAKKDQARIEQQVRAYEARIESSPLVEEEYKQITRDHETALQFYNTLLQKMNESSMATALEHRQQGEQFRVMDAPNLPDAPTFPNHVVFAGGGLASGLMLGLLLAGLLEYRDTSMRNERDVWAFTKLPTLAVISFINELSHPEDVRKQRSLFSRKVKPVESAHG
jgi:polysaccharide chain length determinant protein (PEP-CTERM system associated)